MTAYLSRVDIIDQEDDAPILKVTVTQAFESLNPGYTRDFTNHEILYGLIHDSVTDRATYLQYMIDCLVQVLETEHNFEVDGAVLTEAEMNNILTRYENREETPQ